MQIQSISGESDVCVNPKNSHLYENIVCIDALCHFFRSGSSEMHIFKNARKYRWVETPLEEIALQPLCSRGPGSR